MAGQPLATRHPLDRRPGVALAAAASPDEPAFRHFSRLPFELRLAIWELTIEARLVPLRQRHLFECYHAVESVSSARPVCARRAGSAPDGGGGGGCGCGRGGAGANHDDGAKRAHGRIDRIRGRPYGHRIMGFDSGLPAPGLLLACHESARVASRVYTRSFSALGAVAQTWFGFDRDTLLLSRESKAAGLETLVQDVLPYVCEDELARVERLALNLDILSEAIGSPENYLACVLFFFRNVKTVTLIAGADADAGLEISGAKVNGEGGPGRNPRWSLPPGPDPEEGRRREASREMVTGGREAGSGKRKAGSGKRKRDAGSGKREAGSGKREAGSGKRKGRPGHGRRTRGDLAPDGAATPCTSEGCAMLREQDGHRHARGRSRPVRAVDVSGHLPGAARRVSRW
ncbi:hypothetical protein B2J93_5793 [Marssonina coronariae]|uniref:2EXR domain-containing protein n=1 Tax=Diplocarpon coronariae TaxID=2795749 RepID=A0A218YTZ2_9HELO|nr:hypothetical protein B2J93_5793 [Marssonina coronariae]